MDDPNLDPLEHRRALSGLRRINAICQTSKHLANEMVRIANHRSLKSMSILDLGCGSGDIAMSLARRMAIRLPCQVTGWDISPTAIEFANDHLDRHKGSSKSDGSKLESLRFEQADVFEPTSQSFDIVYCCLFLHHFTEEQAIQMLSRMRQLAKVAVIVDDLQRTPLGLWLAKLGCYLLSRSPVVRFDGPQSVRAAFTTHEAIELARQAGMNHCVVRKHWPERYLLRWDVTS
jgi:2-polyprenyl-3-methyl-5-hydroxy-6-metoxy-1,4-benzoquinol methylase